MKYKRLISVFLIALFVTFQVQNVKNTAKANADLLAPTASITALATSYATSLAPFVPQLALIAVACISAGVVFENRDEIISATGIIYNKLKADGLDLIADAQGVFTLPGNYITGIESNLHSFDTGVFSSYSAPVGQYINSISVKLRRVSTGVETTSVLIPTYASIVSVDFGVYDGLAWDGITETWVTIPYYGVDFLKSDGTHEIKLTNSVDKYIAYPTSVAYTSSSTVIDSDSSVCVNFPDTMIPNSVGSVDVPSVTIPGTLGMDVLGNLVGVTDVSIALDGIQATTIPSDIPVDTPTDTTSSIPQDWSVPLNPPLALDFSPLTMDLKSKFPFSIPWDLKNSIEALSVTPQAPSWTINFPAQYFGSSASVVIDFSQFETWAKIIRWGILITFSFGLILTTRKLIGG